jgi:hypothetical protein
MLQAPRVYQQGVKQWALNGDILISEHAVRFKCTWSGGSVLFLKPLQPLSEQQALVETVVRFTFVSNKTTESLTAVKDKRVQSGPPRGLECAMFQYRML